MTAQVPDVMTREQIAAVITDLRHSWNQFHATDLDLSVPRDATALSVTACVLGLASHVTALAGTVVTVLDQSSNELVAMPLVRQAFECAITAHWLAQVPDGMQAFASEHTRKRNALVADLRRARSEAFRTGADKVAAHILPETPSKSGGPARNFNQMCDDLSLAGVDAYVYYRLASEQAHPSVLVADQYLESADKDGIVLLTVPRTTVADSGWLFLTAASTVWAQMAVNYCDPERRRRNELRAIARKLQIKAELTLSDAAWKRLNKK
ncbi:MULTISPECIES: DUF5677 domain-containing protein [Nocardia]|uniref:DUF5677 domain-containing protein n=1 Tax=Nocardia TaxID=1817 RepID=UPI0024578D31|nr:MULTISPECIES: DUF5677 domain-containing protein [Nocardia]